MLSKQFTLKTATAASLVAAPQRNFESKRLHVYYKGGRNSLSGMQCTMFGGTGTLGSVVGSSLASIGTQCIYPYRQNGSIWDNRLKELKTTADLGYKAFVRLNDFTSQREIDYVLNDSNVVINTIGSKVHYKKDEDFEDSNIHVPVAIAKACRDSKHVKRFIHISAAGADPNSHSRRLRTKWIGEQEVKAIYPDVTILRPTYIMNHLHNNATIAGKWTSHMKMFNRMNWQIEDMDAQVSPVYVTDVALAVMNCLKMEETIGQTYDLAGPHQYSYQDIYQMFFDHTDIKPYTATVKLEQAYEYYHLGWWQSFYRQFFRNWLLPELMTIEAQELLANPQNKGFKDLHITPISFGTKSHEFVQEVYWLYNTHDVTKRDAANN